MHQRKPEKERAMILFTGQPSTLQIVPGRETWVQAELKAKSWDLCKTPLTLGGRSKKTLRSPVIVTVNAEAFLSLDRQGKGQPNIETAPWICQGQGDTADCVQRQPICLLCCHDHQLGQFHREPRTPGAQTLFLTFQREGHTAAIYSVLRTPWPVAFTYCLAQMPWLW